jgi:hypothetical protein
MMRGRCIAYTDSGAICGRPAALIDPQRGGLVCADHGRALTEGLAAVARLTGSPATLGAYAAAELRRRCAGLADAVGGRIAGWSALDDDSG